MNETCEPRSTGGGNSPVPAVSPPTAPAHRGIGSDTAGGGDPLTSLPQPLYYETDVETIVAARVAALTADLAEQRAATMRALDQRDAVIADARERADEWAVLADYVNDGTIEERARCRAGVLASEQLRAVLDGQ